MDEQHAAAERCARLHELVRALSRFSFPAVEGQLPTNGVYFLFEEGELGHGDARIVRIGSHTGEGKLPSRLAEHTRANKDRSIFRKNLGRALLNDAGDAAVLEQWNWDLTTRQARAHFGSRLDRAKMAEIESQVTHYLVERFSFSVLRIDDKHERLGFERCAIATVAHCPECRPSPDWLGKASPVAAIRDSGLWLKQHLTGDVLTAEQLDLMQRRVHDG